MIKTARLVTLMLVVGLVGGCSVDQEVAAERERAVLLDADGDGVTDLAPWPEQRG